MQLSAAGLAGPALCGVPGPAGARSVEFFRIGTGPTAGTLYGLGTAIAAGISRPPGAAPCDASGICGVPGLVAVAQSRRDSRANLRALRAGETESALVHADMAYWAFTGEGPMAEDGAHRDLRMLANLIPVQIHIVTRADTDIARVEDLAGTRVSLGPEGSGTQSNAAYVLRGHGVGLDGIEPRFLTPGPAADALRRGEIDAAILAGAAPVPAIQDLARTTGIRLVSIQDTEADMLVGLYPFFARATIPDGAYPGVGAARTVSIGVYWVVRAGLDPQLAEDITRALWQGQSAAVFAADNPATPFADRASAAIVRGVPLHPGAERYYTHAVDGAAAPDGGAG